MKVETRHAKPDELQFVSQLSARAFSRDYQTKAAYFYERQTGPHARPELTRVLAVDGRAVASVRIQDHEITLGKAVLRIGGIADVGTDPNYRSRGYTSRVMHHVVEFMTEEGFDMTVLFGLQDFYDRFGYITALPSTSIKMRTKDATLAKGTHKHRPFRATDIGQAKSLYRATGKHIWANVNRKKVDWDFKAHRLDQCEVIGSTNRLVGYFVWSAEDGRLNVREIGTRDSMDAHRSLLAAIGDVATAEGAAGVQFSLPPDHPFALFLSDYGMQVSLSYPRNGGGMARILGLQPCIDKLIPQWSDQLSAAGFKSRLDFSLVTDLGKLALACSGGKIRRVDKAKSRNRLSLPQTRLTQLILGYQPAPFILAKDDVQCSKALLPLMHCLFPEHHAFMWPHDHF